LKTFKLLSTILLLLVMFSSCSLPSKPGLPTQIISYDLASTVIAMTQQAIPTSTQVVTIAPTNILPKATASPISTPIPPNVPVWLAYNYTCELVAGGGNMTMNLTWTDRSTDEDGYRVYRDKQVIATLVPDSTSYVDLAFVAAGTTLSYSVEAFNTDWQAGSSTITYGCQ
jgi:hypothetical protein